MPERNKTMWMIRRKHGKRILAMLLVSLFLFSTYGCGPFAENTKIVLSTGLDSNQIFRLDGEICTEKEFMVYLTNLQNRYERVYGPEVWNMEVQGVSMKQEVIDSVKKELEQIKVMNLMSENYKVVLTEEMKTALKDAAKTYIQSLTEEEKKALNVDENDIYQMYVEYATSLLVYDAIIASVNPEISDDEARIITVEQIGVKLAELQADGTLKPVSDDARKQALSRIKEAKRRIDQGEEFSTLVGEYNEMGESILTFGYGEKEKAYEEAAFNLASDQVSDIVETPEAYYLIKCDSTFNQEETDKNKSAILEERKNAAFQEKYQEYIRKVAEEVDEDKYAQIDFLEVDTTTESFFSTFDELAGKTIKTNY